jgi:hypothetical protein
MMSVRGMQRIGGVKKTLPLSGAGPADMRWSLPL